MNSAGALVVALLSAVLAGCTTTSPADPPGSSSSARSSSTESSPRTPAADLTPARLQSLWWTWASSSPDGEGPVEDTTGARCADHQPTEVWLVAGTYGGSVRRRCEVPAGVPLVGPAINLVAPTADACRTFMQEAKGSANLDGEPVPLERMPATDIDFEDRGRTTTGFACGLWARIKPPTPGEHVLILRGSSGGFAVAARYELTVSN